MQKYWKPLITTILVIVISMGISVAQTIKKSDLYGVWAYSAESEDAELLNLTALKASSEGLDIFIAKDDRDTFKIRQNFTWDFDEETQTFSQVSQRITYFVNG